MLRTCSNFARHLGVVQISNASPFAVVRDRGPHVVFNSPAVRSNRTYLLQPKVYRRVPSPRALVLEIARTIETPPLVLWADILCHGVGAFQKGHPEAQRHSAIQQQPQEPGLPAAGYPARTWPKYPTR